MLSIEKLLGLEFYVDRRNFFLVIEGLDGSGKSMITRKLVDVFRHFLGDKVNLTFEPHDPSCSGLFIRQVLMKKIPANMRTLALAFAANRSDHSKREIESFLDSDYSIVVCDRYYLSSLVYQVDDSLSMERIYSYNDGVRKPDITIFLNPSSHICYERMRRRPEGKELFEVNLNKTRQKYLDAIKFLRNKGEKIIEIDSDKDSNEVVIEILEKISKEDIPDWIPVQIPLLFPNDHGEVITINGEKEFDLQGLHQKIFDDIKIDTIHDSATIKYFLEELREKISKEVDLSHFDDICLLSVSFLEDFGYVFLDKFPWTDIVAYQVEYSLPLGINQFGSILFLGGIQGYSHITRKLFELGKFSDFMFVVDPRRNPEVDYYNRDVIRVGEATPSPTTRIINREEIKDLLFIKCINIYVEENIYSLSLYRKALNNYIVDNNYYNKWHELRMASVK